MDDIKDKAEQAAHSEQAAEEPKKSYFDELYSVDVNGKTERKGNLTYLSWAWAWAEVKKRHPMASYTVYETEQGCIYHTDGRTCWVKTGVTIDGLEHIEYLPVMDHRNKSIPLNAVTSTDVNKTIQRSLTKACARHGLGLYIYAGEDLPEDSKAQGIVQAAEAAGVPVQQEYICNVCGKPIHACKGKSKTTGEIVTYTSADIYNSTGGLCRECAAKRR